MSQLDTPSDLGPIALRSTLALWGFMGVGKSCVGQELANASGATFVDLDNRVERAAGKTVAEIFQSETERGFRAREREALEALLEEPCRSARIIALGGGALLDGDLRARVRQAWLLVTLQASAETIALRTCEPSRPLLAPAGADPEARLALIVHLLKRRRGAYAESHIQLLTKGLTPEQLARELLDRWPGGR